jgi:hypothetical protein
MPASVRDGAEWRGGVIGYPLSQIYGEVAFIAYHFHWSHDRVMTMEHADRRRWVEEISSINRRVNEE